MVAATGQQPIAARFGSPSASLGRISIQPTTPHDNRDAHCKSIAPAVSRIDLSIIAPAHNEQDNIADLLHDVRQAMLDLDLHFEMILVDDASTDRTASVMAREAANYAWLRCISLANAQPGAGNGQSAAFHSGIRAARGSIIALMDADRQNDPADLRAMLETLAKTSADMVQGDRSKHREDSLGRRVTSWVGRAFRLVMLGDTIRDTGCSLRVFKREVGLLLPLQHAGMHRFIPFYARALGYRVVETPVRHRPRTHGETKYGIWNRALPGLRGLITVRGMRRQMRGSAVRPIECQEPRA